jgi:uncharacterized membrane protein
MDLESTVQIFIYAHAAFGALALISGLVSLSTQKGGSIHKKFGKVFFYSMLICGLSALVISILPKHESPFLFAVGIFSSYFVLTGFRALNFKKTSFDLTIDKFISWTMILTGLTMMFYGPIFKSELNIVLSAFGTIGLIFSIRDLVLYRNIPKLKSSWLKLHLGKMIGAYISAVTALIVVLNFIPGYYGWFIPGILGGFYINYWIRRLDGKSFPPDRLSF